jgi:hypothetical protein
VHRRELADRGQGPRSLLGQRATDGVGQPERGLAADAIRLETGQVRLGLAQRKAKRVDDEPALVARVASTRRRRP